MGRIVAIVFLILFGSAVYFAFFQSSDEEIETAETAAPVHEGKNGKAPEQASIQSSTSKSAYRNPFAFGSEIARQKRALSMVRSSGDKKRSDNFDRDVDDIIKMIDLGNYEEVEGRLKDLIRKNPGDPEVLSILGDWYYENGRWKDSEDVYQSVVKLDPNNVGARNSLGKILSFQGRHEEAVTQYKEALARDKSNSEAFEGVATTYLTTGKIKEGQRYFDGFLEQNPYNTLAYDMAGTFSHETGNVEKAIEIWKKGLAIGSNPADPKLNARLAMAYAEMGNYSESTKYGLQAANGFKTGQEDREFQKELFVMLGEQYSRAGDQKQAKYWNDRAAAMEE